MRSIILPLLPPRPASFAYRLPTGDTVKLFYREDLGTKVLFGGRYEEAEAAALSHHIKAGSTVFDVGANIGLSALEFARAADSMADVIALEPHPDTAARLTANLARNKCSNVRIVHSAIGERTGTITFHESAQPTLSSASIVPRDLVRSFEVPLTTLDQLWADAGRPTVSAVKIDVEGGELEVLRGGAALVAACRPAILLEAWRAEQLEPIDALLTSCGYHCHQPAGFEPRNYLFLTSDQD